MNGKQLATIFLILAIFGMAQAAVLKTESLTANLAGAAHQGEDLASNPAAWAANRKGAAYKVDEGVWAHRCLDHLQCSGLRRCSLWGWCQDVSYQGPFIAPGSAK